ncbi:MAG: hypothetical protein ACI86M_000294, partial [Saprospiraceae bacterium]
FVLESKITADYVWLMITEIQIKVKNILIYI